MAVKFPALAKKSFPHVVDLLLEVKRYDLVQEFLQNPVAFYTQNEELYLNGIENVKNISAKAVSVSQEHFAKKTNALIQYCKAIGDTMSAKKIQEKAAKIFEDERNV